MKTLSFLLLIISCSAWGQATTEPKETEVWDPEPAVVNPGEVPFESAPEDALILFDGSNLDQWKPAGDEGKRKEVKWTIENHELLVKAEAGAIETMASFGDMQLHIEWRTPVMEGKDGQGYGNSGIFFMGRYEIQVLNSFGNRTYSNGQAGSIYKQHIPVDVSEYNVEFQSFKLLSTAFLHIDLNSVQSNIFQRISDRILVYIHSKNSAGATQFG